MDLDLSWIDIGFALFVLLSMWIGLVRGFAFELLSLAGWFAAWFAALQLTPHLVGYVHLGPLGSNMNRGVTFVSVFFASLVLWSLAARMLRALIRATPLGFFDRLLGATFGLVRGLVVLLVLATMVDISPWSRSIAWQRSQGVNWLNTMLDELRPWLVDKNPLKKSTA